MLWGISEKAFDLMRIHPNHDYYDAVIVGARCAGAATALLLARQGARVLLIDRDPDLDDTLSTHALTRPAVRLLSDWGLLDDVIANDTPVVTKTHFHYGPEQISLPVKENASVPGLLAPRRWLLDTLLRDAAIRAGAEFQGDVSLVGLGRDLSDRIRGATLQFADGTVRTICASLVIGADGVRSSLAKAVGAHMQIRSKACTATAYTYVEGIENAGYRWYFGTASITGLIPTTNGLHCLFSQIKPGHFIDEFAPNAYRAILGELAQWEPGIADNLQARGPAERLRRFPGVRGYRRVCAGPGWALVGDAGYFKDPCTALGITDALVDAHRLARAFAQNPDDVRSYQTERDRFTTKMFDITQEIAALDWHFGRLKSLHLELSDSIRAVEDRLISQVRPNTMSAPA
ncbi:FAD-dependent monooxygenase [uncultured Roseobacter sp.]|uniref:NAD(P)/FAD-dependent oxidoreductase n=1 Tax=uncultured Roseobacter sp. TaxID=114847 RepID=UPI00262F3668|nr:FAD-dependent monooxygenase [uncultured Roseobacter sp.]